MASKNSSWGNEGQNIWPEMTWAEENSTSRNIDLGVLSCWKNIISINGEDVSRRCQNDVALFRKRYEIAMDLCNSKNITDKNLEDILSILNCFDLQNSLESNQEIVKLKTSILLGDYTIITKLIESKLESIKNIDDSQLNKKSIIIMELMQIYSIVTELFFIISVDPIKKESIKSEINELKKIHFDVIGEEINKEKINNTGFDENYENYLTYVSNMSLYLEVMLFSWFSTDPEQSKAEIKEIYQSQKQKIQDVHDFFLEWNKISDNARNDYSCDRFQRNSIYLTTYLNLLYYKFQENTYYNLKCKNDVEQYNIEEINESQNIAILWLFNSYLQVTDYNNQNPRYKEIEDRIKLYEVVSMNLDISHDWVIEVIFEDFLYHLKKDSKTSIELFWIIEAIIKTVNFNDTKIITDFQDKINNELTKKIYLDKSFNYGHGAYNLSKSILEIASEQKKSVNRLEQQNITDELTWASNRILFKREFSQRCSLLMRKSKENDLPKNQWIFSLDIDFFKDINDKFWHDVWDLVLREFAQTIDSETRKEDNLYRVWWEEFMVLCECSDKNWAELFGKKLLETVEWKLSSKLRRSWVFPQFADINITMSVWIHNLSEGLEQWKLLSLDEFESYTLKQVDKALYYSKDNGRNMFTFSSDLERFKNQKLSTNDDFQKV